MASPPIAIEIGAPAPNPEEDRRELRRGSALLSLEPQVFDLLAFLVRDRDRVVSKDDLLASVWGGRIVSESTIATRVNAARRAIGDNGEQQRLIRTIIGKGIRFVGEVTEVWEAAVPSPENQDISAPSGAEKPSIAVLPFQSIRSDAEQEFLAYGIAEDIITALSRYPSLSVIARNSCFTYKGRAIDVRQVGRELGVRYVLEGSLRKAGNRIRVTTQLVESETANHIWAERYDRNLSDIFALQEEISQAVTIAIAPAIGRTELQRASRKPPGSLDAWSAYQRGLWHNSKASAEDNALAQEFFQRAIDLDPSFAGGYRGLAVALRDAATIFQRRDLPEARASSEVMAWRAFALDSNDPEGRVHFAGALLWRGDHQGALAEAERAISMTPNLASAHGVFGATLIFSGRPKEGLAALQTCLRLDPYPHFFASCLVWMTVGLYFSRDYEAATDAAKTAIRWYPDLPLTYRWLAAALAWLGRADEAKEALAKAIAVSPGQFDMYVRGRPPWIRPEDHAHMLEGLRKAGWKG